MKYTAPARDGTIGPRPIRASMLFEFDYRPKISGLLPHESHKEISAHLNIAWKSIGQDILQLYKDLAKKVEQKLKILNGETDERAIQKRKAAAAAAAAKRQRASVEPPPNSGLRRCNCRPDCPKYKIIPGSDLDKRWQARFEHGERPKSVNLDSVYGDSDAPAEAATPTNAATATAGPRLFGGSRSSDADNTPTSSTQGRMRHDVTTTPNIHASSPFDAAVAAARHPTPTMRQQQQQQPFSVGSSPDAPSLHQEMPGAAAPMDIAQAAAAAANVDPVQQYYQPEPTIYYSVPQMEQQQQNFVYHPMQTAAFPPFVDPNNPEQMAQFQGSYIYPDGTIVNANGEPIAVTLPPSQFIVPQPEVGPGEGMVVAEAENNAVDVIHDGVDGATAAAAAHVAPSAPESAQEIAAENGETVPRTTEDGEPNQPAVDVVGAEVPMESELQPTVVDGEVQIGVEGGETEMQVGLEPLEPLELPVIAPIGMDIGEAPEGQAVTNHDVASELPETSAVPAEEQAEGKPTEGQPAEGEPPAFSWHQVQAAEGNEVPAQDIGWTWNKNVGTPSETSLATERGAEEKEKSMARRAKEDGAESDGGEYDEEEVKMDEDKKMERKRVIALDPRQKETEEEDVEIKVTMIKELGEEQEEEEEEEEGAEGELKKCDVDQGMRVETESEVDVEGAESREGQEKKDDEDQLEVEFSAGVPIDVPGLPAGVSVVRAPSDDDLGEPQDSQRAE